jgi:hypothetical protein
VPDAAAMREQLAQRGGMVLIRHIRHVAFDGRIEIDDAAGGQLRGKRGGEDLGNAAQAKAMRWRGGDIKLQVHCSERFGPENFIARATAIDKAAMGLAAMSSRTMVRAPRAVFWVRHRRRWQARRW